MPNDTSEIERANERICTIPANVQVLNGEKVEAPHEVKRQLVQLVVPGIGDLLLNARDFEPSTVAAAGAFLAPRQGPLRVRQFPQAFPLLARVGDAFARGQRRQAMQPKVDADNFAGFGQRLGFGFIQTERDVIAARWGLGYRRRRWIAHERSGPAHLYRAEFCERPFAGSGIVLKRGARVFRALLVQFLLEGPRFTRPD